MLICRCIVVNANNGAGFRGFYWGEFCMKKNTPKILLKKNHSKIPLQPAWILGLLTVEKSKMKFWFTKLNRFPTYVLAFRFLETRMDIGLGQYGNYFRFRAKKKKVHKKRGYISGKMCWGYWITASYKGEILLKNRKFYSTLFLLKYVKIFGGLLPKIILLLSKIIFRALW